MKNYINHEQLVKEEKERIDKERKIADSLIVEEHNRLKQAIAAKPSKMEDMMCSTSSIRN